MADGHLDGDDSAIGATTCSIGDSPHVLLVIHQVQHLFADPPQGAHASGAIVRATQDRHITISHRGFLFTDEHTQLATEAPAMEYATASPVVVKRTIERIQAVGELVYCDGLHASQPIQRLVQAAPHELGAAVLAEAVLIDAIQATVAQEDLR